jgi:hypothetical protein
VFEVKVDERAAIVELALEGVVDADEMRAFAAEMEAATLLLQGRAIKIKADLRGFEPAAPDVAEMIRGVQELGIRRGVTRVAEIVESDRVATQLNRVAQRSGTDRILRRFWEEESAREWLLHGDPKARPRRST